MTPRLCPDVDHDQYLPSDLLRPLPRCIQASYHHQSSQSYPANSAYSLRQSDGESIPNYIRVTAWGKVPQQNKRHGSPSSEQAQEFARRQFEAFQPIFKNVCGGETLHRHFLGHIFISRYEVISLLETAPTQGE